MSKQIKAGPAITSLCVYATSQLEYYTKTSPRIKRDQLNFWKGTWRTLLLLGIVSPDMGELQPCEHFEPEELAPFLAILGQKLLSEEEADLERTFEAIKIAFDFTKKINFFKVRVDNPEDVDKVIEAAKQVLQRTDASLGNPEELSKVLQDIADVAKNSDDDQDILIH